MGQLQYERQSSLSDVEYALSQVWPTLSANESGSTTFKDSSRFEALLAVICGHIAVPDHWHTSEKAGVVRRALLNANRGEQPGADGFLTYVQDAAATLLNQPIKKYSCWSKISVFGNTSRSFYRFRIGDVSLELRQTLPRRLKLKEYFINGIGQIYPEKPEGGAYLVAHGQFRSNTQAGSQLITSMQQFGGLLTYGRIRHRREFRSGKRRPKAKISLGEQFFLFGRQEHLTADRIWYDGDFRQDFWEDTKYQWKDLEEDEEFIRYFVKSISASTSEAFLWSSFRLATKAWSTNDVDDRLAQLWTAFEVLFSRSMLKNDPFEKVIQRASFLSKDRRYARLVLRQAAESRNNYLHRRETVPAVEQLSDWLQSFFAGVIEWIAFSRMGFESHGRFLDMMELSNDEQALTDQISDRERALKVVQKG